MTTWIILAALFAFLLFLATRWVGVNLKSSEEGFTVSASFSRLRFSLYPGDTGGKIEGKEEPKKDGVKGEERKTKDQIKEAIGWLRLASDLSNLVKSSLNFLKKHGRIAKLDLNGKVGTGDPYLTGTFYGLLETLKGVFSQVAPSSGIDVRPDFEKERLDLAGSFGVEIRLIHIVFLIVYILWNLPKRKVWRLARSR